MPQSRILERNLFHAGKIFIRAGERNSRAHVIQKGTAASYIEKDGEEIEVGRYGPGTIIGEVSLVLDEPVSMSFKALTDVTVVSISRQDFEKKLAVADGTIKTILRHIINKANAQEKQNIETIIDGSARDETAMMLVHAITHGMGEDKKKVYELAITPHINGLVTSIKDAKEKLQQEKAKQIAAQDDADDMETQNLIKAASYLVEQDHGEEEEDGEEYFEVDENRLRENDDDEEL